MHARPQCGHTAAETTLRVARRAPTTRGACHRAIGGTGGDGGASTAISFRDLSLYRRLFIYFPPDCFNFSGKNRCNVSGLASNNNPNSDLSSYWASKKNDRHVMSHAFLE
jgi:hypothetical protein